MNFNYQSELLKGLEVGFVDRSKISNPIYVPEILTNDSTKNNKVLSALQYELRNCTSFWFNVAFVTSGGVATIINELKELENKGVRGKILVSQYQNFTQPEALLRLLQFKNIELKIVTKGNMHAKGYLFKNNHGYNYIVGSSNLTDNALKVNQELNIKISAAQDSNVIYNTLTDFEKQFHQATLVDKNFIEEYLEIFKSHTEYYKSLKKIEKQLNSVILPNKMQVDALENIAKLRSEGKNKAILISATGTGKTYLSAFDVKRFKPKKLLFLVHRRTIAEKSLESYREILGDQFKLGMYSGNSKDVNSEYLFSTIQTISKEDELKKFSPEEFEYIVIDESHRAGAESYKKIMSYFKPKFLLGMTATPERTDGYDIFGAFDHNVAYEIRLHKALEENMLCPFHYYGITDLSIDGNIIDDKSDFNKLISSERIKHILNNIKFYGSDNGKPRGLIFCSRTEEAIKLSELLNNEGFRTVALTGDSSEDKRRESIKKLESTNDNEKLDYIITVDIFNEGVDIPKVNQVIMLRPTQSAIIFVQQLGRGLRKTEDKEYLTVLDFIGNYSNNFLVPIALFGDSSYNKDNLRKLIYTGSDSLPGASTVSFDEISKKRIFEAIDNTNFNTLKDLKKDYMYLEHVLGRKPLLMDFINLSSRDPKHYLDYSKSLYNFEKKINNNIDEQLNPFQIKLLELFSGEISNGKRIEELIILEELINNGITKIKTINECVFNKYKFQTNESVIKSAINVLNFGFIRRKENLIIELAESILLSDQLKELLTNALFKKHLLDIISFGKYKFDTAFDLDKYKDGFLLYQKYSRKDVCRILCWGENLESTMYGYMIKNNSCPIFVNYHKEEGIDPQINFPEGFVDNSVFQWFSKPYMKISSPSIQKIENFRSESVSRFPFFIKKHNGEGDDFYYMGDVLPIDGSFEQSTILDKNGDQVPVVKIKLKLFETVKDDLFEYLTLK